MNISQLIYGVVVEYSLFPESMPDYEPGWFQRDTILRIEVQQQLQAALDAIDPDIVHGKLDKAISRARNVCQAWKNCPDEAARLAAVAARFSSPHHPNGWDSATVAAAIKRYVQPSLLT